MILLWGVGTDPPLAAVRTRLAEAARTAVLVDQRAVLDTSVEVSFGGTSPKGFVACGGLRVDLACVTAAYVRPYDPFTVPEVAAAGRDSAAARHALGVHEALTAFSELTPACVVNRTSSNASNASKPYQAELIRAAGFSVPETLLTTDPEAARAFCQRHGEVIYKSASGVRSVVSRVTLPRRAQLDSVTTCPTQFQRHVAGDDVRVHVVDGDLFACQIHSAADDYRYPCAGGGSTSVERRPIDLPDEIAARCRVLARNLGLLVAGINLRRAAGGAWVCFEVNPAPAFTYFDQDGSIGRRVTALLCDGPRAEAAASDAADRDVRGGN